MVEYTGERYLPWLENAQAGYEHLHRYAFAKAFAEGKRILDLASGEGYGAAMLAEVAESVVGVDIAPDVIQHASSRYQRHNLNFLQGSIMQVPIQGEELFDLIVCFEAIEHVGVPEKVLREVKRLLKKGGIFIVSTPDKLTFSDEPGQQWPWHIREFYFQEFRELLNSYFKDVIFLGQRVFCGSNIWSLEGKQSLPQNSQEIVIERGKKEFIFSSLQRKTPLFFVALASDSDFHDLDERLRGSHYLIDASGLLLMEKEQLIQGLSDELASIQSVLKAREEELAAVHAVLQTRDEELASIKPVLQAREEELAAVHAVLQTRDEELASIKSVLRARDEELAAVKFVLRAREEELANTKAVLCVREDELVRPQDLGLNAMPGPVICTIVCKNYLAHARCLAQSFLAHHPNGRVFVALADRVDGYFDPAAEPFTVVEAHELNIPEFDQMAFRYTLVEFNTAVKPFFLEYLFNRYDLPSVCYFDPDIYFYQPITLIEDLLTKHTAVLVPHITEPLDDDRLPDEPFIMRAGVYNLGFIGLSRRPEMYDLLHWWQKKLLKDCVVDTARGLFVDQRWMDLAPSLFEGIAILRDPGFDVAYWNLNGRRVRRDDDQWLVNDQPLVFYHFSGLMLSDLNAISKHQNRYTLRDLSDLKPLFEHYRERLNVNDFRTVSDWPYTYGRFDNDVPIPDMARHLWRGLNGETRWPQPFIVEGTDSFFNWLNRGVDNGRPLVTNLAMELYRQRRDLQQSFSDVLGVHREGYARWFVESAENYAHFDVAFAQPVAESLPAASETPTLHRRVDALYRALVLRQPIVPLLGRPTWYRQVYCAVRNPLRRLGLHRALKRLLGRSLVEKIDRRMLFGHRVSVEDILRSASAPPAHDVFSTSHDARSPQPAAPPHGLNVVGYMRAETGVGEVARSILRALAALDFPTAQTDLSNPEWARADDDSVTHLPAGHPYDYNLLCVNADMLPLTANHLGSRFFAGKYNIGFWHWETTHFPRAWFDRFAHLNEIWVDSGFMQKHLAEVSPIPVVNVGLPVNALVSSGISRGDLGLPEDRFLFLFSFDARSYIQRKNPRGLIEAYRRALGSAFDQTMLIIKATNLDEFPQEAAALRADVESVGGRLIVRYMDRQELSGLFMACDAYVSLHRSEGFGLTIAEAMALGKPVIATAYSGNMEFMTPSNSYLVGYRLTIIDGDYGPYRCGGEWADPDLDHAAELMRLAFADRAGAAAKGAQAAADMRRDFGNATVGRRIIARLERIRQERNGH